MTPQSYIDEASTPQLELIIRFRGWWMPANDFRNGDTWEAALLRHKAKGRHTMPQSDHPDLPAYRLAYARKVRASVIGQ